MKKHHFLGLLIGSTILLTESGNAQVISPFVRRGPTSVLATGMSVRKETRALGVPESTFIKDPGDQVVPPHPWGGVPVTGGQYAMDLMFPVLYPVMELDAHSTGNDIIPTNAGVLTVNFSWAGALISVSNEAVGTPGNGWIDARAAGVYSSRITPGADLAAHYVEGSIGINEDLAGSTVISQLSEHIGFQGDEDIDGFDLALGVIPSSADAASTLFFTRDDEFYFSVTPECAQQLSGIPFALEKTGGAYVEADPVTVYQLRWDVVSQTWGEPSVFHTAADLQLDPNTDNVDALAVSDGYYRATAYSTQPFPGRSQLMVYEEGSAGPGVYPIQSGGKLLTSAYHLRTEPEYDESDDVDAICFIDPEAYTYGTLLGTPLAATTNKPVGLGATCTGIGKFKVQVTGFKPKSHPVKTHSRVTLWLSTDYDPMWNPDPTSATWTSMGSQFSSGGSPEFSVDIPPSMGLSGATLYFWATVRKKNVALAALGVTGVTFPISTVTSSWVSAIQN